MSELRKEDVLTELADYEAKLQAILNRFSHNSEGIWISREDDQPLLRYVREIVDLLDAVFGKPSSYSEQVSAYYDGGKHNIYGSPSYRSVGNIIAVVQAVQTHINRSTTVFAQSSATDTHATMVNGSRLEELRSLTSESFDFAKLIRLCEELNTVYAQGCYYSTALAIRSLLDHIPPLFGKANFGEVANNYSGGGRSFKEAMHGLEHAARKIADGYLHAHIRRKESLPTAQQVYFAAPLDLLLGEIIRTTSAPAS